METIGKSYRKIALMRHVVSFPSKINGLHNDASVTQNRLRHLQLNQYLNPIPRQDRAMDCRSSR